MTNQAERPEASATGTGITESEAITFPDGIPGFESCRRWVLLAAEQATPLRRLHAVDGAEASFLAIDPRQVLEGYRCALSAADRRRIGAAEDEPLLWLALVMVEENGTVTANLRAPIVINPRTMTGQQVLPHNCLYPVRHVLLEAE
jgi:flagellar assembly factor FliW